MSTQPTAEATIARLKTELKAVAEEIQQDIGKYVEDPNLVMFSAGLMSGLAIVGQLLKGGTVDDALTQIETGLHAAVGKAYLTGKLTAADLIPTPPGEQPFTPPPPGSTIEQLPADVLALLPDHRYTSTACQTGHLLESDVYGRARHWGLKLPDTVTVADLEEQIRRLHKWCRLNHKFTGQLCVCNCHSDRVVGVMAACRTCRGNRIVPDRSVPGEYGEPVPKPCSDCQPTATKEATP
jgi:hypothetical protein